MTPIRRVVFVVLFVLLAVGLQAPAALADAAKGEKAPDHPVDPALFESLEWRHVGPWRGGRAAAVAGIPQDRDTYYFGATGGGVWKTTDAGRSWQSVSDGFFGGSIGAVAVSAWDPNVVYVGTGEKTVRGNVSHGDGMWKSVDAGETWTHVGLGDTRHIPRVRVHPRDPETAWVCALGHLFGPNEERGVFKTTDGGATWEKVLFVNENAGCIDLALDPTNPRVLYSTFWRVLRTPYSLESGGEGSTMWKSTDGGATWNELTANEGLPEGTLGIMGLDVSAADPKTVYAIVEAEEGGVFRSKDGGETWAKTNTERALRQRAWYYTRIYADPNDVDSVYVVNVRFHHSKDGGRTFSQIPTPHGDNHDLWIDPNDSLRMIQANDGGVNVSNDGGATWTTQANQPTAQMYRVATDNAFPYRLLGGQQDNSSVRLRSRAFGGGPIGVRDWEASAGCECGHMAAKPDDPDLVFGGCYGGQIERLDHSTGQSQMVDVWPDDPMGWGAENLRYRFQWNFPIFFSPHDPNRLYTAAQMLFRSDDLGQSWEPISPDLTRDAKDKQGPSGGPITKDNTSVEYYSTIFAAIESPHEAGVYWTGSDDGLVHLSRDGGETWQNVTPKGLPEWAQINGIDAHPTEPGGLYLAATRYKSDDFRPYLYKTTDYGATWTKIVDGIAEDHFTRAIRADSEHSGLLFSGTERGVYVSYDDGARWQPFQGNLPIVPITDLAIKDGDLIAATQGRGFWILDDLSPVRQIEPGRSVEEHHLYAPRVALRLPPGGFFRGGGENAGTPAPEGAVFHYVLGEAPAEDATYELAILDADGEAIRTFTRKKEGEGGGNPFDTNDAVLEAEAGAHRFVWDLRHEGPEDFDGMVIWNRFMAGPTAVPGTYTARLTVGEWSDETTFEVKNDPRSSATQAELEAQLDFLLSVRDEITKTHEALGKIRDAKSQLTALEKRLGGDEEYPEVRESIDAIEETLGEVEKALYQTQNESPQDPLNFPIRLNDKLAGVYGVGLRSGFAPTEGMRAVRDALAEQIDAEIERLDEIWNEQIPALEALVREKAVPVIVLGADEEADDGQAAKSDR